MKLGKYGAACAVLSSCATAFAQYATDTLVWFGSDTSVFVGSTEFVAVTPETLDKNTNTWQSKTNPKTYQPFKTMVNADGKQIYWRKDEPDLSLNFYGEIYHYDASYIYLHSETFPDYTAPNYPPPPPSSNQWDKRGDFFRWFVRYPASGVTGPGRIIAPRTFASGWSLSNQQFDLYRCGVDSISTPSSTPPGALPNATNGYLAVNNYACPTYTSLWNQSPSNGYSKANDVKVTVEMRAFDYATEYLNTSPAVPTAPADSEITGRGWAIVAPSTGTFVGWSSTLIINQTMYDAAAQNFSRERFILGYDSASGKYHGLVAWDRATSTDPDQVPWHFTDRTLGLKRVSSSNLSFSGFNDRSARDRTLPPAGKPTIQTFSGQPYQCVWNSNMAYISWNHIGGSTQYQVRVDDLADSWNPGGSGSNDIAVTVKGTSYMFPVQSGHNYNWWVHASNNAGDQDPVGITGSIQPNCSGSPPANTFPSQPTNPSFTAIGDVVKLSWDQMAGATGYDIRIDDTSDAWQPNVGNDVAIDNIKSNSFIFRIPNTTHQYTWWVHSRNSNGENTVSPTSGPSINANTITP